MIRILPVLILALLFSLPGCRREKPPGWDGDYPGGPAQMALKGLSGKTWKDPAGVEWKIDGFVVEGDGPFVHLSRAGSRSRLPMNGDGDAADFCLRVTGSAPAGVSGEKSETYEDSVK